MNCELGKHIQPQGWYNWGKVSNEQTARYMEYNNQGEGAMTKNRVIWSKQLTKKEIKDITLATVFQINDDWNPIK
jgi:pectinesterase